MSEGLPLRDILVEVRDDVKECRVELGELRLEVATTAATKTEVLELGRELSAAHDKGLTRAWEEGIKPLVARVEKLERSALNVVAGWLRAGAVRLLLPVATGVAIGVLVAYVKGCG